MKKLFLIVGIALLLTSYSSAQDKVEGKLTQLLPLQTATANSDADNLESLASGFTALDQGDYELILKKDGKKINLTVRVSVSGFGETVVTLAVKEGKFSVKERFLFDKGGKLTRKTSEISRRKGKNTIVSYYSQWYNKTNAWRTTVTGKSKIQTH